MKAIQEIETYIANYPEGIDANARPLVFLLRKETGSTVPHGVIHHKFCV